MRTKSKTIHNVIHISRSCFFFITLYVDLGEAHLPAVSREVSVVRAGMCGEKWFVRFYGLG